ncbi:MAG: mandelate racemase/muconate lactonizing enzyme family protein [Rhodospirillaceae bacterium]|jgi:L-alanine-DL-glutamate epimerase-like enolase superfamily enzyme|nr:mandelate racemase/muconate lactonizing enzyme family protein [Rhodospirillaceae bacterium]MBT4689135.1 mandelate racemase/muconate lactonizing enzyme family protein [Rhodospirillaceae bacterium]MBT5080867.1 mandelate racemase/muconate lactonizing enzyme family protein [Rhodospirillaceae bacterium]MBT5525288.1 mandelate racemase/muconate lactonizing enzyme family protein [Rhodospirillaceae bacterium]MBT5877857.1 mandelate racemase/muconate lactonizing enzyme family protein [Rhodospirillaceae
MKITGCETLHCGAGWRNFSFLKLQTDDGITGISEYNESYGSKGLTGVIEALVETQIGENPCNHEAISQCLYAMTRQAPGGINQQAMAAIENAMMDIKGKALGVPVYDLLGGAVRDKMQLYWSHCGSYLRNPKAAEVMGLDMVNNLDDVVALGARVKASGYKGLKTNIFMFGEEPGMYMPGFGRGPGYPELNLDRKVIRNLRAQLEAFREGAGPDMGIHLDINFNCKTEGYLQMTRALDDLGLTWFEIDLYDPEALRHIRNSVSTPIASCESLFRLREFRPFFENHSMDVAIIDLPWNGIFHSMKIAAMAEAYEINVAPHNFYGHLSSIMSAHMCAAVPNFRVMEIDVDDVPWKDDIVTYVPEIEDGYLKLPKGPGWGTELNEDVIRAHPPI